MTSLGILQLNTDEYNEYLNRVAVACGEKGIFVFRFHPSNYDDTTEKATGLVFDPQSKQWLKGCFSLPDYIYDRVYYPPNERKLIKDTQEQINVIKKKAHFLGTGLPNKWAVHQWLSQSEPLKPFLPQTEKLTPDSLQRFLNTYNKVAIKPVFGSGGYGFFAIENKQSGYVIESGDKTKEYTWTNDAYSLYQFLTEKLPAHNYMIQPFLPLTIDGSPYDLRIVLQKKGDSQWKLVGKGFRLGKKGTYLSNLQAGGKIVSKLRTSKETVARIKKDLPLIIKQLPKHMENYHEPLFELGVDIGISNDGRIWILEVNSKPGYETVMKTSEIMGKQFKAEGPAIWILSKEHAKNPVKL
ncbi:MAG: YheC/YheD family protein [Bacillus sp. (in: Bacteria)]|nr:YheC/YheD family protein [Bacillus sp. (in: firmicutes)]